MERFLPEQALKLVFDYTVALTDGLFYFLPIENLDVPPVVANRSHILQPTGGDGHAFAAHAQHIGNQCLRHDKFIRRHTVMA